jgi:apolipoprotein N-acyltransferase
MDLLIWPETAYPFPIDSIEAKNQAASIPEIIQDVSRKTGAELIMGGYDFNKNANINSIFESEYNTVFHFNRNGELKDTYNKIILIPFGETLPLGSLNEWLSPYLTSMSFFATGNNLKVFNLNSNFKFITPICYEILQHDFIRSYLNSAHSSPHFIVNLTNDSWYGDTSEPRQHLFLSHWIAMEMGLPIIRSTNTGITSVLYPDGTESKRLAVNTENYLDHTLIVNTNVQPSLFQKFGILVTVFVMFIFGLIIFAYSRIRPETDHANAIHP